MNDSDSGAPTSRKKRRRPNRWPSLVRMKRSEKRPISGETMASKISRPVTMISDATTGEIPANVV
jgi:hypothetical protein